jgi:hypothetical protein
MAAYYPRRVARFADLQKAYPGFETYDDFEEDRIESVAITKSRGKGAPKKKRTAAGKWERVKRRKRRGLLTFIQSPRSLARRRGRRYALRKHLCFAVYPTRAKARACKNTHTWISKARREEHWDFKKRRFTEFSGMLIHISGDGDSSPCTKNTVSNHHTTGALNSLRAARMSPTAV